MKYGFRGINHCKYYINANKIKQKIKKKYKIDIVDICFILLEVILVAGTIFGIVNWCIKFNMLCGG